MDSGKIQCCQKPLGVHADSVVTCGAAIERERPAAQAEFYLLEYAAALASAPATWALAAEYLAWCPAHGEAALRALLERLPVADNDRLALRALQVRGVMRGPPSRAEP